MAWIQTVPPEQADEDLARLYKRAGNPDGTVDNVMQIHSLHPASLRSHFDLYVQCMHRPSPLSKAERELIGSAVSRVNSCEYCLRHHASGLKRLLPEERRGIADDILAGETSGLNERERALVAYAEKLATRPGEMAESDVDALRNAGLSDREILDTACITAYFCYANRIALGLGIRVESFPLGQHPTIS